jgi:hypothetical protein
MLNNGNNDREQNWLLLSPRMKRAQSDWWATVPLGVQDANRTRTCNHFSGYQASEVHNGIRSTSFMLCCNLRSIFTKIPFF